jgi:hypothetical protein
MLRLAVRGWWCRRRTTVPGTHRGRTDTARGRWPARGCSTPPGRPRAWQCRPPPAAPLPPSWRSERTRGALLSSERLRVESKPEARAPKVITRSKRMWLFLSGSDRRLWGVRRGDAGDGRPILLLITMRLPYRASARAWPTVEHADLIAVLTSPRVGPKAAHRRLTPCRERHGCLSAVTTPGAARPSATPADQPSPPLWNNSTLGYPHNFPWSPSHRWPMFTRLRRGSAGTVARPAWQSRDFDGISCGARELAGADGKQGFRAGRYRCLSVRLAR